MATTANPEIKLDPAEEPTPALSNADDFVPDTSLNIPEPPPNGPQAWLVQVPRYIWDAWNQLYREVPADNNKVEIGSMRVYMNAKKGNKPKTQIILSAGVPHHHELPKTYDLDIKTEGYSNTVVFSEKDLSNHKNGNISRKSQLSSRGIRSKSDRYGSRPSTTNSSSSRPTYRTAIPKQTSLAPLIHHVADAAPEQNDSYWTHLAKSYAASTKPKNTTTYLSTVDKTLTRVGGPRGEAFTISSHPRDKKRKTAAAKDKNVRMSEPELLDALYKCFRRYKYCGLKYLKNELRQPEAYIRQTLEKIATLVRSGDAAMNYVLRPEFEGMAGVKKDEVKEETAVVKSEAELTEGSLIGESEGEGEEDFFEDVVMEGQG